MILFYSLFLDFYLIVRAAFDTFDFYFGLLIGSFYLPFFFSVFGYSLI